ncbi:MAG: hypothetical protein PHP44_04985 [Kiritimatiellae bacterium]|nr:hypothetical protein [Kiritimatiellia bacterium]MDD4735442.1 hypothetical protein [Kiritimatiellia bacterium]
MNDVLKQLSLLIGGVLFFLSLLTGIITHNGVSGEVLFRALMVFFISTMTIGIFFRFFAGVLYNFVVQKMDETRKEEAELQEKDREYREEISDTES